MAQRKDTKTNTWYYYGVLRLPGGKSKQYKKRGFSSKGAAKKAEDLFRLSVSDQADPSLTLEQLVELYAMNAAEFDVKESTLVGDEVYYRNHIQEVLGSYRLADINTRVVSSWLEGMAKKKKPDGSLYSPRTINHAKNVLSKYISYAVQSGYIAHNPVRDVRTMKKPDTLEKVVNFWEVQEFEYFISFVDDDYWKAVFTFLFWTGLREGELFALTWADVNLARGTCRINKSITNKTKSGKYKVTTPKTEASIRVIDLQSSLCELLRERYAVESLKDGFSSAYYVFGDIRPLSRSHLARHLDEYILKSGVSRITPHGFRHSHVSFLVHNKVDDSLVAERLGHSVAELRATYTHIYREARQSLKSVLDEICKKRPESS